MGRDAAAFHFFSRWELGADPERVWQALVDFRCWPRWWPGLEKVVETIHGDPDGIGQTARSVWRGPVGYTLEMSIEAVERRYPEYLRGVASGDVVGEGVWRLEGAGEGWTAIEFDWNVRANRTWMEFLAPVARPVFIASHDQVVQEGAEGLAAWLEAELRSFESKVE